VFFDGPVFFLENSSGNILSGCPHISATADIDIGLPSRTFVPESTRKSNPGPSLVYNFQSYLVKSLKFKENKGIIHKFLTVSNFLI
jgi:hypothetical protein